MNTIKNKEYNKDYNKDYNKKIMFIIINNGFY